MSVDDWVEVAMENDSIVAELLMRLKHDAAPPRNLPGPALPFAWSVRQRRSKPIALVKKPPARASPNTPLSWRGGAGGAGTSVSGDDGFEDSARALSRMSETPRSKVVTSTTEAIPVKRSRKRKTVAELKEEELSLIKEKKHLKREIASMQANMEKQRVSNEDLKRLKLDLRVVQEPMIAQRVVKTEAARNKVISDQAEQNNGAGGDDDLDRPQKESGSSNGPKQAKTKSKKKRSLPDLNAPVEEEEEED